MDSTGKRGAWALLLSIVVVVSACERRDCEDGTEVVRRFLQDTVPPTLCMTDELRLAPRTGDLFPARLGDVAAEVIDGGLPLELDASVDGIDAAIQADASVSSARGDGFLRMVVIGVTDRGLAQEAAHVDISLESRPRGASAVARLRAVPSSGSEEPDCSQRSDAELRCRINVHGFAAFDVVHLNAGEGTVQIGVKSGDAIPAGPATIRVFESNVRSGQRLVVSRVGASSAILGGSTCSVSRQDTASPPLCSRRPRGLPMRLQLQNVSTGDLTPFVGDDGRLLPIAVATVGGADPVVPKLSSTSDCTNAVDTLPLRLRIGDTVSFPFYLCVGDLGGSYVVQVPALDGVSVVESDPIDIARLPRSIVAQSSSNDAGLGAQLEITVRDCAGRPFATGGVSWTPAGEVGAAAPRQLDGDGRTTFETQRTDRGRIAVVDAEQNELCSGDLLPEVSP